jgi:hypothetical protein
LITRIAAALALAILLAPPPRAEALPRYSARYEQKCALCHVNPSGGGLRNAYASERLVPDEIAWRRSQPALLNGLDSTFSKFLLIGTDFREVYIGSDVRDGHLNFFQMQGDLYFDFQLEPRVSIYYDRGRSDTYEMFGLGYLTPHIYAKAGRFVPSYGWKFDDHTMFVRDELGLAPPSNSDVGLEAGYSKGAVDVQLGVVNGSRGNIRDNDTKAAGALNVVARHHMGPFGMALGASGYHRPSDLDHYDAYGGYGYLTWRSLTWMGEADLVRRKPIGGDATVSVVSSHEVTWLVRQGLEVKATYDFYDPDRDVGAGAKSRWGGGVSFMPYPYMVLEGLLRRTNYESGVYYSGMDALETVLQLHMFR